jgi:MFS transporter, DHA1 family, multidrug resistance protein
VGGFVTESYLGWRWTAWFTLILAGLFGTIGIFAIPETSAPRILQLRARRLRFETKNWALHAKADENPITLHTITHIYLLRPWVMLVQEPILALMTAYMSYLYGVLYLLFVAYPFSFHEERGWSLGVSALPFIAFIVGVMLGTATQVYSTHVTFRPAYLKYGKPIPEQRLPPMVRLRYEHGMNNVTNALNQRSSPPSRYPSACSGCKSKTG